MLQGTLKRRSGRAAVWLVVGLLVGGGVGAAVTYVLKRGKAGIEGGPRLGKADEFDLVPADSAGFVHLRLRGLWNAEAMSEVRKIADAAGPAAKATLDESFVPAPSTLDRLTVVFVNAPVPLRGKGAPPPPPRGGLLPLGGLPADLIPPVGDDIKAVVLLAFNAPFDANKVRDAHAKAAVTKKSGDREYWEDAEHDVGLFVPNDTTLVVGDVAGMKAYLAKLSQPGGPLAKSIEHARAGGFHFAAAVNVTRLGIPVGKLADAPDEFKDVAKAAQAALRAEAVMLGTAWAEGGVAKVEVRATYKDEAAAAEGEKALREIASFVKTKLVEPKKEMEAALNGPPGTKRPRPLSDLPKVVGGLFGLGAINSLDEWLADPPLKTDGADVVFAPKLPSVAAMYAGAAAVSVGMMMPAIDKVQLSAGRMKDSNNLKQLAVAMHNHEGVYGYFPSQDGGAPGKKGGLSWRVHLLPFIEQENLYKQFKLDEPWDSPTNKKLIEQMPATYASPLASDPAGQTRYKVFSGTDAVIYPGSKTTIPGITDGTSNTILIAGGGAPVTWTKPDDIPLTRDLAPSVLALPGQTGCNVAMADGSVRWVELAKLTPERLRAAVTRHGGEVFGLDTDPPAPIRPVPFPAPKAGPPPKAPNLPDPLAPKIQTKPD